MTISNNSTSVKEIFDKNGFYGPFKVYEPEVAKEKIKKIRMKSQDRENAIFDNDCYYDRHFDIDELTDHIANEKILAVIREILDNNNILCWRTEYFPKFPGSKGTEWHQVERFQYTTGNPQLQPMNGSSGDLVSELTVWTAFTDATIENGCMKFLPGSHKRKLFDESLPSETGRNKEYAPVDSDTDFFGYNFSEFKVDPNWDPDSEESYAIEMKAGEAIVFTAKCVHGSYPNITKDSTRFAITARYVTTDTLIYPNQESFIEHGGKFDLTNYGAVLVSGEDEFKLNRIRTTNAYGKSFLNIE